MSRISEKFLDLKQCNKTCLISYVTAGDPSISLSLDIMHALVESGTDIIELGVPFSDPNGRWPNNPKSLRKGFKTKSIML